ncbi:MAG: hypothetical protein QS721_15545 [Candidatus Endonucleobacter sp. (ex Gigantidas childressi)]|nr:hypothetical protein [Candidatus Endonucleobacter sp. (ex Gigantidas childressi)]
MYVGWGGGWMGDVNKYKQLAVSQSFINIKGTKYIIGGAVGGIDTSFTFISNFTVSRSRVLFEGKGSNVQIGFCLGENKDGNSACKFDETKKIFNNSSYNDANGVSHHQYNYNMNLANQCKGSKLPFIGNDCEIKPEEYRRYKEPVIMVWNAPCLTQAPEQATTVPTILLGASGAAFIAVAAVGGGVYWYKRHNNGGGCCSGHRELSTEDDNHPSGKEIKKLKKRKIKLKLKNP